MFGLIPISCIIFMVEFFHVLGFSISSMDVIILLFVVSSLHSMLILLCVMLCVMSLIPVSIYRFSLGVDVGTINTRFIMLSSILLIVPFSSLFGSHSSHAYVIMGIMQVSISFRVISPTVKMSHP